MSRNKDAADAESNRKLIAQLNSHELQAFALKAMDTDETSTEWTRRILSVLPKTPQKGVAGSLRSRAAMRRNQKTLAEQEDGSDDDAEGEGREEDDNDDDDDDEYRPTPQFTTSRVQAKATKDASKSLWACAADARPLLNHVFHIRSPDRFDELLEELSELQSTQQSQQQRNVAGSQQTLSQMLEPNRQDSRQDAKPAGYPAELACDVKDVVSVAHAMKRIVSDTSVSETVRLQRIAEICDSVLGVPSSESHVEDHVRPASRMSALSGLSTLSLASSASRIERAALREIIDLTSDDEEGGCDKDEADGHEDAVSASRAFLERNLKKKPRGVVGKSEVKEDRRSQQHVVSSIAVMNDAPDHENDVRPAEDENDEDASSQRNFEDEAEEDHFFAQFASSQRSRPEPSSSQPTLSQSTTSDLRRHLTKLNVDQLQFLCDKFGLRPGIPPIMISSLEQVLAAMGDESWKEEVAQVKATRDPEKERLLLEGIRADSSIYEKVLMFEPVPIGDIQRIAKAAGVKGQPLQLMQLLDPHGVTIQQKPSNRRRVKS
jgi:hypothetical protein